MQSLANIRIVLVETTHPGNIGATARAMKTMGLTDLRLVSPREFPSETAVDRAVGAVDVLAEARVHATLSEAIADCRVVVGATARNRTIPLARFMPRDAAEHLVAHAGRQPVAIVFGRESSGLSNQELDLCTHVVGIPANPEFSSLNLAAAVQVLTYELRVAALGGTAADENDATEMASHAELEMFYTHLAAVLAAREFLDKRNPEYLMRRLRHLFGRVAPDRNEVQILRGILKAVAPDVDPRGA